MHSIDRKQVTIFYIVTIGVFSLYIYHNPVRWLNIFNHFSSFFLGLHPYVLFGHMRELLLMVLLWLGGYGLGACLLASFQQKKFLISYWNAAIPIGWGIMAYALVCLAWLQCLNAIAIGSVVAVSAIVGVFMLFRNHAEIKDFIVDGWTSFRRDTHAIGLGVLLAIPIYYAFCSSLMPPTQSDGLRYHLTVPKLYLEHGGFYLIPHLSFSNFPLLIEHLFSVPLAFGLIDGPKLIHCSYFLFTLAMVYALGKRMGDRKTGLLAALLIATTPFVPIFASWSFIEFGLTCYTLLGFVFCLHWLETLESERESSSYAPAILIGIAGGMAVCCKYTALATLGFFSMAVLVPCSLGRYLWKQRFIAAVMLFAVGIAVSLPWFVKNYVLLGNPVYPFAGSVFPTPGWTPFNAEFFAYHAGMKGNMNAVKQMPQWWQAVDCCSLPFRVTFFSGSEGRNHPDNFGSWPIGAAWLISSILFLIVRRKPRRWGHYVFVSVMLFLLWAATYRDTRFLLPCFAVMAPMAAWVLYGFYRWHWTNRLAIVLILLYGLAHTSFLLADMPRFAPWQVISGQVSANEYLETVSEFTRHNNQAFRYLRDNTERDETVLIHGTEQLYYCPNRYVASDWFNTDPLVTWSQECDDVEDLIGCLQDEGIRYIVYQYGNIQRYNVDIQPYYRLFCMPQEVSLPLLRELVKNEKSRIYYPYVYQVWIRDFLPRLNRIYEEQKNVRILRKLLDSGVLEEVFRYDEDKTNPREGVVVLKVPED